jgi:hypothetical protein
MDTENIKETEQATDQSVEQPDVEQPVRDQPTTDQPKEPNLNTQQLLDEIQGLKKALTKPDKEPVEEPVKETKETAKETTKEPDIDERVNSLVSERVKAIESTLISSLTKDIPDELRSVLPSDLEGVTQVINSESFQKLLNLVNQSKVPQKSEDTGADPPKTEDKPETPKAKKTFDTIDLGQLDNLFFG